MQKIDTMDWDEILSFIKRIEFFKNFSEREIKKIIRLEDNVYFYQPTEYIIKEGDSDTSFLILISGTVSITKGDSSLPIAKLEPGDFFGEISFLTDKKRTANAVANEMAIVIKIDKKRFEKLGANIREKIKDKAIEKLVARLEHMNRAFITLYY